MAPGYGGPNRWNATARSCLRRRARVFMARGYAGAGLEAIAEEAGFSVGIMYSQFGSKADLFFALLERRIEDRALQNERIAKELAGAEACGTVRAGLWRRRRRSGMGVSAGGAPRASPCGTPSSIGATPRRIRGQLKVSHRCSRGSSSRAVKPPVPARSMAEFLRRLAVGVALKRAANPDAFPIATRSSYFLVRSVLDTSPNDDTASDRVDQFRRGRPGQTASRRAGRRARPTLLAFGRDRAAQGDGLRGLLRHAGGDSPFHRAPPGRNRPRKPSTPPT